MGGKMIVLKTHKDIYNMFLQIEEILNDLDERIKKLEKR